MADGRAALALVLLVFVVARATESWINRRHTRTLQRQGAVAIRPDGFLGIAATQALTFVAIIVEGFLMMQPGALLWRGTVPFLVVAACAILLRHWCIATLGDRWTFRVWILPEAPLVRSGPYRFLRHPNYLAVFLEYVAVPLAFALWTTALIVIPIGAATLLYRKRIEETALAPLRRPVPNQPG
jgi:methyltransferase